MANTPVGRQRIVVTAGDSASAVSRARVFRPDKPFGDMKVIATDQGGGRRYRCACGWTGWSAWGHAGRHAERCPQSGWGTTDRKRGLTMANMMCPHCGQLVGLHRGLTEMHDHDGSLCPGWGQYPRNPESDGRPLWNGKSNPHFYRNRPAHIGASSDPSDSTPQGQL